MANEVRIPVPAGLTTHAGPVFEVVLQPPTYDAYLDLGEIVTWGKAPDGTVFTVQNSEVLRSYIARCLVQPKDPLVLNQGGLALARAVRGAVLDFFRDDSSASEPSPTSPTTSSSPATAASTPPASAA